MDYPSTEEYIKELENDIVNYKKDIRFLREVIKNQKKQVNKRRSVLASILLLIRKAKNINKDEVLDELLKIFRQYR